MKPENIAYAARVNAAYHLIRKASKIARRLADTTIEQQQVIEYEIAVIGMRMYSETCEQPLPETTHDPHARAKARHEFGDESERDAYVAGVVDQIAEATHDSGEDLDLVAYVAAVRELDPCVERWFIYNDYKHGFSVEKSAERWREFGVYLKGEGR